MPPNVDTTKKPKPADADKPKTLKKKRSVTEEQGESPTMKKAKKQSTNKTSDQKVQTQKVLNKDFEAQIDFVKEPGKLKLRMATLDNVRLRMGLSTSSSTVLILDRVNSITGGANGKEDGDGEEENKDDGRDEQGSEENNEGDDSDNSDRPWQYYRSDSI
ncbi:hypothetical protein DM02DRAFT_615759 [Periconia macrospinosa]|uniref:Uncharacterized protein n=1 Tax=Periconia macrospinosa TaxID=97972 RepID=A0A2V1DKB7_9PLEO|nr:hypothetical protein DM02DRAFT_615759 [Periconia macrospinosa]